MMRALALALAIGVALPAHAQPSPDVAAAEAAFEQGRALAKDGNWQDACAAFERSQKLDPQFGTMYNLAECDVHLGKLAAAWTLYRELASRDNNAARRDRSFELAHELVPRLPKLLIQSPRIAGLAVAMNGVDATRFVGVATPVDLGSYQLVATAPGFEPWHGSASVREEGKTVDVEITLRPIITSEPASSTPVATVATPPPPATSHRTAYAIGAFALGGAFVAGALVSGELASGKWNKATALCPENVCADPSNVAPADELAHEARTRGTIADVLVAAGVVAAGAGVYLIATRPRDETPAAALRVVVGPGSIALTGGF